MVFLGSEEEHDEGLCCLPETYRQQAGYLWVKGSAVPCLWDVEDFLYPCHRLVACGAVWLVKQYEAVVEELLDRTLVVVGTVRLVCNVLSMTVRFFVNHLVLLESFFHDFLRLIEWYVVPGSHPLCAYLLRARKPDLNPVIDKPRKGVACYYNVLRRVQFFQFFVHHLVKLRVCLPHVQEFHPGLGIPKVVPVGAKSLVLCELLEDVASAEVFEPKLPR